MRNHILCLLASTLTLVGCSGSRGSTGTPDGAFEASIAAVQEVDFVKVLDIVLPAEGRAKLELDWEKQRKKPMSAEQAAETNRTLAMLTAEGAEDNIYRMLKPELAEAQASLKMMSAMLPMMVAGQLQGLGELSDEEREVNERIVTSMSNWFGELDITDEAKAKKSIAIACEAARSLGIGEIQDIQEYSLVELLDKASQVANAAMDVTAIYGLDLKDTLNSMEVTNITTEGDESKVKVKYTFLGEEAAAIFTLRKHGENWFPKSLLESVLAPQE